MEEILKTAYYLLQKVAGKERRLLQKVEDDGLLTVLNFHQVSPNDNPFWPPLSPHLFDDLLSYLKRHFEIVTFRQLGSIKSKKPLLILSFDDGYKNFLEYAVPILEKHDLTANMNIIPKCVEESQPIWNVRLYDFLNSASKQLIDEINLPGLTARLKDNSHRSKLTYGLEISKFLKNRSKNDRSALLEELEEVMANDSFHHTQMMNVDEIKQISTSHEVGVHSYSHESMAYESLEFFEDDLERCSTFFSTQLEMPMDIYAFPNGSYNDEQIKVLQDKNIRSILLVGERHARTDSNVFNRITIYGTSSIENRFRSLGLRNSL